MPPNYLSTNQTNKTPQRKISQQVLVPQPINLDSKERVEEFLSRFDYILTDCDGVLYVNNDPVPGVPETLNKLRKMGKKIVFATNNSTKTREEFMKKLKKLGYQAEMDELFPTCYSTAIYLKARNFDKKAYVVGMSGIEKELAKLGIECDGVGYEATPSDWTPGMCEINLDPDVAAVIVGFDNQISFCKLAKACSYAKREGCLLLNPNPDETYPSPEPSIVVPGPGAYVAAIETVTGKSFIGLGKPFSYFFDCIKSVHPDIDPKRTVMIGDRLTTDMVFGKNNNLRTLFVQTGLGTLTEMNNYYNSKNPEFTRCVPDYYLQSLADMYKHL